VHRIRRLARSDKADGRRARLRFGHVRRVAHTLAGDIVDRHPAEPSIRNSNRPRGIGSTAEDSATSAVNSFAWTTSDRSVYLTTEVAALSSVSTIVAIEFRKCDRFETPSGRSKKRLAVRPHDIAVGPRTAATARVLPPASNSLRFSNDKSVPHEIDERIDRR